MSAGFLHIHFATITGNTGIVKVLLEKEPAFVHEKTEEGFTPLHMACGNGRQEVVELLLSREAAVDATTQDGSTSLHLACMGGHIDAALKLLEATEGALSADETDGRTPLHAAAQLGDTAIMTWLFRGAVGPRQGENAAVDSFTRAVSSTPAADLAGLVAGLVDDKTENNKTPLDVARDNHHPGVVSLLTNHANLISSSFPEKVKLHESSIRRGRPNMQSAHISLELASLCSIAPNLLVGVHAGGEVRTDPNEKVGCGVSVPIHIEAHGGAGKEVLLLNQPDSGLDALDEWAKHSVHEDDDDKLAGWLEALLDTEGPAVLDKAYGAARELGVAEFERLFFDFSVLRCLKSVEVRGERTQSQGSQVYASLKLLRVPAASSGAASVRGGLGGRATAAGSGAQLLPDLEVEAIEAEAESHDQGWSSFPDDHGTYRGSWSWGELKVLGVLQQEGGPALADDDQGRLFSNLHAVRRWQSHAGSRGPESSLVRFLNEERPGGGGGPFGCTVQLLMCAAFPGWVCFMRRAAIRVYFRPRALQLQQQEAHGEEGQDARR
ncbi:hypothetical protein GPECTOR_16g592 [Gonium pectorale]|uniref:Uncharacterized protein n=1 Tax=Gonium pectorale TaxID=33097 RepID=A0A150GKV5_GONPE|nr:hypothetical protein GPECTOR_16g592 [Gonium pectorale]|eukprot:KXZ50418.1 hypothetical protein GPECTOR_16g592 [Gonium pectorale]